MHTFLIAALTADGFIAKDKNQNSTRWTSKEDANFFSEKTKEAGVVVMGRTTFETINRPLPGRKIYVYTSRPLSGFLPEEVEATKLSPAELIAKIGSEGYTKVAICGGAKVYTQFMQEDLIDTIYLTIEPVLFGAGVRLFDQEIMAKIRLKNRLLLSDQTTVLEYEVQK